MTAGVESGLFVTSPRAVYCRKHCLLKKGASDQSKGSPALIYFVLTGILMFENIAEVNYLKVRVFNANTASKNVTC